MQQQENNTQVCVWVRGGVPVVMATTAELREDEDDEGALRCIQDSGVFLQTDFTLRRSPVLSGHLPS